MATSITVNAATLNRPGVFVAQSVTGGLPQPLASHAVGYIFGTTPADEYYGSDSEGIYSEFLPYTPTQVASAEDYLLKIGGSVPNGSTGALVTYDSIKGFFENVGVNGILYFTRVTPTPETVIDLSNSTAGNSYNAFALKINGRYFGTPINVPDSEGDEIRVITTTGIDQIDNARDLFSYLSSADSDGFSDFYKVEQTATEATQGKFRIFSRDNSSLPLVEKFRAFSFTDTGYETPVVMESNEAIVKLYTSVKEINFRCSSRYVNNNEPVLYVDGSLVSRFIAAGNAATPGTYDPATEQSKILKAFLASAEYGVYATEGDIPEGKVVAVSIDYTSGVSSGDKWSNADAAYWQITSGTFAKLVSGSDAIVPVGIVPTSGPRQGYLPDSVQVFYVSVAGENRAVIVNGATPDELSASLRDELINILAEKNLSQYYEVEAVPSGSNYNDDKITFVPNNGHRVVDNLVSSHGAPYIRPDLQEVSLSGTVAISGNDLTGSGTNFTRELGVGDIIVVNGTRYEVTAITDADNATVDNAASVDQPANSKARLDNSLANGFQSFDYVLKIRITAKNGVVSPVLAGVNRQGLIDSNVVKLSSITENVDYESYKISAAAKAQDFSYAIEKGMSDGYYSPGFLFAPEAYSTLKYSADSDLASRSEAIAERLKVSQTLVAAAEGRYGVTEGITNTQHVAIIDLGGDVLSLPQAQEELNAIKRTIGAFYGHAGFYGPYVKNLDDRFVPASGFVVGAACSRIVNEGFQQPPAGSRYPLRGVTDLQFKITAQQQEVTYALGLNPIRSLPNRGIVVWGARTLSSSPLFRFVNTRVILNVLVDVMNRSFDDILFESIDSAGAVYSRVKSIATQVLNQFYRQGALFGNRPEQAYLVICGESNNSASLLEQGTVRMDAYVATSPTLERLAITIVRTPVGQVSLLSDSFSRNEERFSAFLDATNLNV